MGRRPNIKNRWLKEAGLKHVTTSRGRYVYRPYANGKWGKEVALGRIDAPRRDIIRAYDELTGESKDTLLWLVGAYMDSRQFKELADRTQSDYHDYRNIILSRQTGRKRFGDAQLKHIDQKVIRHYLDTYPAKVSANRHIQFLKSVFNWGLQRFDQVKTNPCIGVTLNPEEARDRYVTQEEYDLVHQAACESRNPFLPLIMEFAYLCRARRGEVLALTRDDVTEEGILLRRGKGSRSEITLWTPRLSAAYKAAKDHHPNALSRHLIHNADGKPITNHQVKMAWQRAMAKAKVRGLEHSYTLHDLKARGISNHPQKEGGHKSKKMAAVYDRVPKKVEATE
jgi:integrase